MKTAGKIEIPDGAKKEAQFLYLHDIVSLVDDHNIPDSLILNLDQTKLKYVLSTNHTLARKGSQSPLKLQGEMIRDASLEHSQFH